MTNTEKTRGAVRRITLGSTQHAIRLRKQGEKVYFSIEDVASLVNRSPNRAVAFVQNDGGQHGEVIEVGYSLYATADLVTDYLRHTRRLTDNVAEALDLPTHVLALAETEDTRRELTDVCKEIGFEAEDYRTVSKDLYRKLFGFDTESERENRGLKSRASLRASLTPAEQAALFATEHTLAHALRGRIERGHEMTPLKVRRTLTSLV
jgi:hypothetical protein